MSCILLSLLLFLPVPGCGVRLCGSHLFAADIDVGRLYRRCRELRCLRCCVCACRPSFHLPPPTPPFRFGSIDVCALCALPLPHPSSCFSLCASRTHTHTQCSTFLEQRFLGECVRVGAGVPQGLKGPRVPRFVAPSPSPFSLSSSLSLASPSPTATAITTRDTPSPTSSSILRFQHTDTLTM